MTKQIESYGTEEIRSLIVKVRGQTVILDADLAAIYGVKTKALNQAVKRNSERFPEDFILQLTRSEAEEVRRSRSQIVTLKRGQNIKYLPYVFTEHGALMAANVLSSPQAIKMSVFVVRAFVRMRGLLGDTRELARQLADLEKELKERLDVHEVAIVGILQRVMNLIDPPLLPSPPRKSIGFKVKEKADVYKTKKRGLNQRSS
ncbi:MAG: ORF6N domain-containing protein [Proteobacteria bacterium]|nr:ORF6N domain-containing protein [Pseudomonadota bacterium]